MEKYTEEQREKHNLRQRQYRAKRRLIKYKGANYSTWGGKFTRDKDLELLGLTLEKARIIFDLPYPYDEKDNPEPSKEAPEKTETRTEENKENEQNQLQNSREIKPTSELFTEDEPNKNSDEEEKSCCDDEDNWCWLDEEDPREYEAIKLGYREVCSKCYNLR